MAFDADHPDAVARARNLIAKVIRETLRHNAVDSPYYAQDQLLADSMGPPENPTKFGISLVDAEQLVRNGKVDDAIQRYREAAEAQPLAKGLEKLLSSWWRVKTEKDEENKEWSKQRVDRAAANYEKTQAENKEWSKQLVDRAADNYKKRQAENKTLLSEIRGDVGDVGGDIFGSAKVEFGNVVESDDAEYPIWYGTNRTPIIKNSRLNGYSTRRDGEMHYGLCYVFVPKSHKIGSTGSAWWKRLVSGKDDRLRLLEVRELESTTYWLTITSHLETMERSERHAVIFVHGFNVSFKEAALRAAQIGFDLSIRSAMAFFSWPSQGRLGGYLADAAAIEASEEAITDFLVGFAERSGARMVHIIAHSMGNRGVLRAVDRITQLARRRSSKHFGQVILAAADVDADLFRQRCAAYTKVARRTTMYVSVVSRVVV